MFPLLREETYAASLGSFCLRCCPEVLAGPQPAENMADTVSAALLGISLLFEILPLDFRPHLSLGLGKKARAQ